MDQISESIKKPTFWTRRRTIVVIVLIGLLIRLWAAWQLPVDYDEPTYLDAAYKYAQMIQAGDINGIIDFPDNSEHPPLVKLIYGLTFLALGRGAVWDTALLLSRGVSVIFGTISVLLMALVDPLAGGFMAVQTLVVKYTSQAYLEALPSLTSLLAIMAIKRSSSGRDKWFTLSALALGLTAAGKYSYFPILLVILYLLIWEKRNQVINILLYLAIAAITFFVFDPALWHDPIGRLVESVTYHAQYAQGAHVLEVGYPWYQPLLWVSRSFGFVWHPDVFFYMGIDGLIFLLALPGIWLEWKRRRWVTVWIGTSMLFLVLWPTKWPQYTLVVLPAFCLAASTAVKVGYRLLREQEMYWEWFHNMFPRPSRRYIVFGGGILGLLILAILATGVIGAINRIGWSSISANTSPLPSNTVYDIVALPDGRMLLGTDGGAAIWKAASGDEVVDEWTVYNPENSSLPNRSVLAVAQDRAGILWFGTMSGLASLDGQTWSVYRASDFGLPDERVNTIVVDNQKSLWIGTNSGASMFDGVTWTPFTTENSGLVNDSVFSIAIQPGSDNTVIWFGTLSGISTLDTTTGLWESYSRPQIDLGWGGISDLFFDSTGRLWASTLGGGISLWDGKVWSYLRVSNSHLPYSTITDVDEIEPGVFWIAASIPNSTGGVLARYDGVKWHIYKPVLTGYSGAETLTIAKDASGRYWFGTHTDGIELYKPMR